MDACLTHRNPQKKSTWRNEAGDLACSGVKGQSATPLPAHDLTSVCVCLSPSSRNLRWSPYSRSSSPQNWSMFEPSRYSLSSTANCCSSAALSLLRSCVHTHTHTQSIEYYVIITSWAAGTVQMSGLILSLKYCDYLIFSISNQYKNVTILPRIYFLIKPVFMLLAGHKQLISSI